MPEEKDYVGKVYDTLKDNIEGFDKTPEQFDSLIRSDNAYRTKVFKTLSETIDGFDKDENTFSELVKKKIQTTPQVPVSTEPAKVPSLGFGSALEASQSISPKTATSKLESPSSELKSVPIANQKNFEKRIQNPVNFIKNEDGSVSTHRMASAEVDGKQISYPTIVEIDGNLKELSDKEALDFALKNNEYKEFKTQKEAQQYAEGGYKKGTRLENFNPIDAGKLAKERQSKTSPQDFILPESAKIISKNLSKLPQIDRQKTYDKAAKNIISRLEPSAQQLEQLGQNLQWAEKDLQDGKISPEDFNAQLSQYKDLEILVKQDNDKLKVLQNGYEAMQEVTNALTDEEKIAAKEKYSGFTGGVQEKLDGFYAGIPATVGMMAGFLPYASRMVMNTMSSLPAPAQNIMNEQVIQNTGMGKLEEGASKLFKLSQAISEETSKKYDKGIIDSFADGDIGSAANQASTKFLESLLPSLAAASSGGVGMLGFGAQEYYGGLKDRTDLTEQQKMAMSSLNGALEFAFEGIGTKAVYGQIKNILTKEGKEAAEKYTKGFFQKALTDGFGKYAVLTAPVQEFISEYSTAMSQGLVNNTFDEANQTSLKDLNKQALEEGVVGAFGGEIMAVPTIPAMFKTKSAQDKATAIQEIITPIDADLQKGVSPAIEEALLQKKQKLIEDLNKSVIKEAEVLNKMPLEKQQEVNGLSEQVNELKQSIESGEVSEENVPIIQAKIDEQQKLIDGIYKEAEKTKEVQVEPITTNADSNIEVKSGESIPNTTVGKTDKETFREDLNAIKKRLYNDGSIVFDKPLEVGGKKANMKVLSPTGRESILHRDLTDIYGEDEGLREWDRLYSPKFKKEFGDISNPIVESYTKKLGTPSIGYVNTKDKIKAPGETHSEVPVWARGNDIIINADIKNPELSEVFVDYLNTIPFAHRKDSRDLLNMLKNNRPALERLLVYSIMPAMERRAQGKVFEPTGKDVSAAISQIEREFKNGFLLDENGEPHIFMHAGAKGIKRFRRPSDKGSIKNDALTGQEGIYFSRDIEQADKYANAKGNKLGEGKDIYYAMLKMNNPYYVGSPISESVYKLPNGSETISSEDRKALEKAGFDGIVWGNKKSPYHEAIVFEPNQIKTIETFTGNKPSDNEKSITNSISPKNNGGSTKGTESDPTKGNISEKRDNRTSENDIRVENGSTNTQGNTTESGTEQQPTQESPVDDNIINTDDLEKMSADELIISAEKELAKIVQLNLDTRIKNGEFDDIIVSVVKSQPLTKSEESIIYEIKNGEGFKGTNDDYIKEKIKESVGGKKISERIRPIIDRVLKSIRSILVALSIVVSIHTAQASSNPINSVKKETVDIKFLPKEVRDIAKSQLSDFKLDAFEKFYIAHGSIPIKLVDKTFSGRPQYDPVSKNITIQENTNNILEDYIAELSHAIQDDSQNLIFRSIKDWVKSPYITKEGYINTQYDKKGSLEHEAHQIIEQELWKEYESFYKNEVEDFKSEYEKSKNKDSIPAKEGALIPLLALLSLKRKRGESITEDEINNLRNEILKAKQINITENEQIKNKTPEGNQGEDVLNDTPEQKAKFEANNQKALELGFTNAPQALRSIEKRTGVKYDNFEDIPPYVLESVSKERSGERGKRVFTRKFLENKAIRSEIKQAVSEDEGAVYYEKLPLDLTEKEANNIVNTFGVDEAISQFKSNDKAISTPVRNALGFAIINYLNENKEYAKAADLALEIERGVASASTDAAQSLNSFKIWYRMHPATAVIHAQKLVREQFDKKLEGDKRLNKVKDRIKKINKESAEQAVENLSKNIENASKIEVAPNVRPKTYGESNRLVSKQRYDDLRKRLKGKFHSGVDPELIELAAYHLEATGRKFADFSTQMIKDLGTKVRPYLKSLYDGAKGQLEKVGYEDFESEDIVKEQFSALLNKTVKEGVKNLDLKLKEIIIQHYTLQDFTGKKLAEKLVDEAGLSGKEAQDLSDAVQKEFNRIAIEAKKKELDKIFGAKKKYEPKIKTLEDEIIKLTNLGAFSEDELVRKWAEKMDYPVLTAENVKEIERLAKKVQDATDGFDKNEKIEDLLAYQANIKGIDWHELPMAIWYANMLSGIGTQMKNVVSNTVNSMLLMSNAMLQNPTYSKGFVSAYLNGIQRGLLEAGHTLQTGYSPIRGKVDVPAVLERKKFTGFGKPLNYYKYVRRVMIAADVITYEGVKEMRAYQLGLKQSLKDETLNTRQSIKDKAAELVGYRSFDEQNARYSAEQEAESKIEKINDSSLSVAEKKQQIDRVNKDVNRRIYELIEQTRPARILEDSHSFAKKATYNYQPEGVLGAVTSGMNYVIGNVPLVKLIIPFTNIISNVANETLNYTPLGFISASTKGGILSSLPSKKLIPKEFSEQDRVDAYVKAIMGTSLAVAAFMLSGTGDDEDEPIIQITANGHGDFVKNESLKETGWQPYSVKIGSKWVSYQYTPLVLVFSYIGNIRDFEKYRREKLNDKFWSKYGTAATWCSRTFLDATAVSSLDAFIGAIMDGHNDNAIEKLMKSSSRTAKAFVVPALYEQEARRIEDWFNIPDKQTQGTMLGNVLRNIPYARDQYFNKVNGLGREIPPDADLFVSGAEDKFSEDNDIWNTVVNKKSTIPSPSYSRMIINDPTSNQDRALTQQEFYDYSIKRGERIRTELKENLDEMKGMNDEAVKDYISGVIEDANKYAKGWLVAKDKKVFEEANAYSKEKKEIAKEKSEAKEAKAESKLSKHQLELKDRFEAEHDFAKRIEMLIDIKKNAGNTWYKKKKDLRRVLPDEFKKAVKEFDKNNENINIDL